MRGLMWSTLLRILIVVFVVVIMLQVFNMAFGQGRRVLDGGLSWIEDKTGLRIGPGASPVNSISFSDGSGSISYTIDLASRRENDLTVSVYAGEETIDEERIPTGFDENTFSGSITMIPPASIIEVRVVEEQEAGTTLVASQRIIAVDIDAFGSSGSAANRMDELYAGLELDADLDRSAFMSRMSSVFDLLEDSCEIRPQCGQGGSSAGDEWGYERDNALGAGADAYDGGECFGDDACRQSKARVAGWIYCLQHLETVSPAVDDAILDASITSAALALQCTVREAAEATPDRPGCFDPPLSRMLECDTTGTVWTSFP